jgi:hypothetical protein
LVLTVLTVLTVLFRLGGRICSGSQLNCAQCSK